MSDKKDCPELFKLVGAASVLLRHAAFDLAPLQAALDAAIADGIPELKGHGIARMEIAEAELHFHKAKEAALHIMIGHDKLRAMLDRHGIATPTDEDICKAHKAQAKEGRLSGVSAATSEKLVTRGNVR